MAFSNPNKRLLLLPLIALFLMHAHKVHSQDDYTDFQFNVFNPNPSDLIYQGDAHVPSGAQFLRLTKTDSSGNPQGGSVGRVLYATPVRFWEPGREATFETNITFFITPVNDNPADGITFFIGPVNSAIPSGSSGGNLGIFNSSGTASNLFAVEFDVYLNGWDPSFRHIGIDVNSRNSRNTTRFNNPLNQLVTANINYDAYTNRINVVATSGSRTSTLTYVFDLKTILPQRVSVGISASTGSQVAVHDILSWQFSSALEYDSVNNAEKNEDEDINIRQVV